MKINKILKVVFPAVFVVGAISGVANAAQRVDVHADYRGKTSKHLEVEASRLRQHVDHPDWAVPPLAHTDVLVMTAAAKAGNIEVFAKAAAKATAAKMKEYIETELLAADGAFIVQDVCNDANAAAVPAVVAAKGAWAGAGFDAADMPADLTRDAFITAFNNLMDHVTLVKLNAHHGGVIPLPARLTAGDILNTRDDIRNALKAEIQDWMDALINPDAPFVIAGIPNAAGGGLLAGAHGMPHAATVSRNHFTAAFQVIVDLVEQY